jgi:hypothetical protein
MNALSASAFATLLLTGCGSSDPPCVVDDTYAPVITPAAFSAPVANPLWPLTPGTVTVFAGVEERVEITVTDQTKEILGVRTTVVRDVARVGGAISEDTYDWFAADGEGNVWYFGEDTTAYEDGQITGKEGSWEAGVDGARPGIVMHGVAPALGVAYRQEYLACVAEDMAHVVSLSETVTVPYGRLDGCLQTEEYTPLEPDLRERKYFCPGVGLALEVDLATGERVELVEVRAP